MSNIQYVSFDDVDAENFIPILNKISTRKHLVAHDKFDSTSVKSWVDEKLAEDRVEGCIVRAIKLEGNLVGWCGIQLSELGFEIAIVLDDGCWGIGKSVFKSLISWSQSFGHENVYIHLLHTRPEYAFLRKASQRVFRTDMLGDRFITYELNVGDFS